MKKICCVPLILLIHYFAFAQKKVPEFGVIDTAELRLESCLFEPYADAMKLFDTQEVEYDPDPFSPKIVTRRHVRMKIFNNRGFKYANITIPFYSSKKNSKVRDLKARIYSLDISGNLITQDLNDSDFYKQRALSKVEVIRFTFPNLKPGSIIEYTYIISEKNRLAFDPWIVQSEIPAAFISNTIITPEFSSVDEALFGNGSVDKKTESFKKGYRKEKRIYYTENIGSFRSEPFMSSQKDNLLKLIYRFFPEDKGIFNFSWDFGGAFLLRSPFFGGQIRKTIPGTEAITDSAKKIISIPDRIKFIYEAVKKQIPEKTQQTLYPQDISEAWKNRYGNTADINLLLLNLLQKADIKCYPLLISTRDNGKINMGFPTFGQMNGVNALVLKDDKYYILDGSLKFQSFLTPPVNILNRHALILDSSRIRWVLISDDRYLFKEKTQLYATCDDDGTMKGNAKIRSYDYAKTLLLDSSMKYDDSERRFIEKKDARIQITKQTNADDTLESFLQDIQFSYQPVQSGPFYFINPQMFSSEKNNPFIADRRITDVDLGCNQTITLIFLLKFSPSFTIESLPKNIILRMPDSSFLFTRTCHSDSSEIYLSQTFQINRAIFAKEEYLGIKEYFKQIYALLAEEIILKKIR